MQGKGAKLCTVVYTAFIKACGSSPGLVDAAHAAFKKMVWGPRRMKPNQVTFVTMMRVLREAARQHDALDVYLGMRRAGQYQPGCMHLLCKQRMGVHVEVHDRATCQIKLTLSNCPN